MTDATPNAWLPKPLRRLAGRALETALNHTLSLDPDTQQRLIALNGRRVVLHLRGPEIALAITVNDGRLIVGPPDETENATTNASTSQLRVAATPGSLLAMLFKRDDDGISPGKVEIAGDAELARRLEKLASAFAPDFEEAFARTFGDVLGVPLARVMRKALTHAHETATHLTEDTADWLREESRIALAPGEVEGFLDGVDVLRERSERLESRLQRLARGLQDNAA